MGYSNNKWRKILTILMIINLCFILFAKITKSFGAFSVSYDNIEIPITDSLLNSSPYYVIFASDTIYDGTHYFWLVRSNSPIKLYVASSGSTRLIAYNTNENGISAYLAQGQTFINYLNNTTFSVPSYTGSYVSAGGINSNWSCVITNHDITNINNENEVLYPDSSFNPPFFDNVTEIENGYPDGVFITPSDYLKTDNLYFHLLKIDNTVSTAGGSIYYYSDKTFLLNEQSSYYSTYQNTNEFYYYIPRSRLSLDTNSSYIYVLNNSSTQIQNTNTLLEKDVSQGIYDVVNSDTTGVITETEAQSDKLANIEQQLQDNYNGLNNIENNINNTFNNTTVTNETESEINTNLNFNNQNSTLNNLNNGFFSRLTTMISNLIPYNLNEDTTINIPYPNSNKNLTLHSNIISSNLNNTLILIINSFWIYIFSFYLFKFINKIYIAVTTGNILDTFNSNDEAITNNML